MFRTIENDLIEWKNQPLRKPLLVRGARQVGKSYIIEQFGKKYFEQLITVNFELEPRFIACFESLDPYKILQAIEIITQRTIKTDSTLLFFDEIQQCPKAIMALRYFKEKLPQQAIIGAGSFLELVINDEAYQQPVGRVQSLYMKPCSFHEYLLACGESRLLDYLANANLEDKNYFHEQLLERCRNYFIIGGMPEAIEYTLTTGRILGCERIHSSILEYYKRDLAKYSGKINTHLLEKIFIKTPALTAKRFKYVDIDPDIQARDIKPALTMLVKAGIIHRVYHTAAQGLPLAASIHEKKFKLLFLDLGLIQRAMGLDLESFLQEPLMQINQGRLAEQFVGQELAAYSKPYEEPQLYYWEREQRGSLAEVDYVIQAGNDIYPVEVKAGKTGRLKSLQIFLKEKNVKLGICISQNPLSLEGNILYIPLYMISELPRLVKQIFRGS